LGCQSRRTAHRKSRRERLRTKPGEQRKQAYSLRTQRIRKRRRRKKDFSARRRIPKIHRLRSLQIS